MLWPSIAKCQLQMPSSHLRDLTSLIPLCSSITAIVTRNQADSFPSPCDMLCLYGLLIHHRYYGLTCWPFHHFLHRLLPLHTHPLVPIQTSYVLEHPLKLLSYCFVVVHIPICYGFDVHLKILMHYLATLTWACQSQGWQ